MWIVFGRAAIYLFLQLLAWFLFLTVFMIEFYQIAILLVIILSRWQFPLQSDSTTVVGSQDWSFFAANIALRC